MYTHLATYIHTYTFMHGYLHIIIHVFNIYVCVHLYIHMSCMSLHIHIFTCEYACIHPYMFGYTHSYMYVWRHICMHTSKLMSCMHTYIYNIYNIYIYIYIYIWRLVHANTHTFRLAYKHACMHTYLQLGHFQPRNAYNFGAKCLHNLSDFHIPWISILLEIWKSDYFWKYRKSANTVISMSVSNSYILRYSLSLKFYFYASTLYNSRIVIAKSLANQHRSHGRTSSMSKRGLGN